MTDTVADWVERQLANEKSGYDHNINQRRCSYCSGDWHGLAVIDNVYSWGVDRPRQLGCPGEYGSQEDKREFLAQRKLRADLTFSSMGKRLGMGEDCEGCAHPGFYHSARGHCSFVTVAGAPLRTWRKIPQRLGRLALCDCPAHRPPAGGTP